MLFQLFQPYFDAGSKSWSTKPTENGFFRIEHKKPYQPNQLKTVDPNRINTT